MVLGAPELTYTELMDGDLLCSFKTYGGSLQTQNGLAIIDNTAVIVTWYRQDIQVGDRLKRLSDDSYWEVILEPENVDMANQYLIFKVKRVEDVA
jgi:hypothetical protein